MIENIKFKILPAGEGKTRWLVEKAFESANEGKEIFFESIRFFALSYIAFAVSTRTASSL